MECAPVCASRSVDYHGLLMGRTACTDLGDPNHVLQRLFRCDTQALMAMLSSTAAGQVRARTPQPQDSLSLPCGVLRALDRPQKTWPLHWVLVGGGRWATAPSLLWRAAGRPHSEPHKRPVSLSRRGA